MKIDYDMLIDIAGFDALKWYYYIDFPLSNMPRMITEETIRSRRQGTTSPSPNSAYAARTYGFFYRKYRSNNPKGYIF